MTNGVASWQPLALRAEDKVIWTSKDGARLVRILNPDTLEEWAAIIGHSGGNYAYWACERKLWMFLTFLDDNGNPHCTFHLKRADALFTPQPEDGDPRLAKKIAVKSTQYDDRGPLKGRPCIVDGEKVVLMAWGHRDNDGFFWHDDEFALACEWLDSVEIV